MKADEIDQQVNRAFRALGQVEPPRGMEERLVRRLAKQSVTRTPARWQPRLALAAAIGTAALAVSVAVLMHRETPRVGMPIASQTQPASPLRYVTPATRPKPVAHTVVPRKPVPSRIAEEPSFPVPPAPLTDQEKMLVRLAQAQQKAMETAPQLARAEQPDVPLTHEETLLVAVSRVRQDAVIEALDPVRRAEADAREKQEFNAYLRKKDGGSL
jgi:hypothetical protein